MWYYISKAGKESGLKKCFDTLETSTKYLGLSIILGYILKFVAL